MISCFLFEICCVDANGNMSLVYITIDKLNLRQQKSNKSLMKRDNKLH